MDEVDAVYVANRSSERFETCKAALNAGKHVLCESPIAFSAKDAELLFDLAEQRGVIMQEAIKTAHALAFSRMLLLVKSNHIGEVRSVDATCTSLAEKSHPVGSLVGWGPIAALAIFSVLGTDYNKIDMVTSLDESGSRDVFTRANFTYSSATASLTVANGAKSEGDLVIAGTKGYVYVPSPWWKTDYFELRFEDFTKNKRYFYQIDGEGIRFEISAFAKAVTFGRGRTSRIPRAVSVGIADLMGKYFASDAPVTVLRG